MKFSRSLRYGKFHDFFLFLKLSLKGFIKYKENTWELSQLIFLGSIGAQEVLISVHLFVGP